MHTDLKLRTKGSPRTALPKPAPALLASVLKHPGESRAMAVLGLIHLLLAFLGFPGWPCPIFLVTGMPCPGCGMTRAATALLRRDWSGMAATHLFAPVFLALVLLLGGTVLLPEKLRQRFIAGIEHIERQTGITLIILFSLLLYWGLRLCFDPSAFIALMARTT